MEPLKSLNRPSTSAISRCFTPKPITVWVGSRLYAPVATGAYFTTSASARAPAADCGVPPKAIPINASSNVTASVTVIVFLNNFIFLSSLYLFVTFLVITSIASKIFAAGPSFTRLLPLFGQVPAHKYRINRQQPRPGEHRSYKPQDHRCRVPVRPDQIHADRRRGQ